MRDDLSFCALLFLINFGEVCCETEFAQMFIFASFYTFIFLLDSFTFLTP